MGQIKEEDIQPDTQVIKLQMLKVSTALGELEALRSMYHQLERDTVGAIEYCASAFYLTSKAPSL